MTNRSREARALVEEAERQGFRIKAVTHGWLCFPANGQAAVFVAGTASDHRSIKNSIAALRRQGLKWPPS